MFPTTAAYVAVVNLMMSGDNGNEKIFRPCVSA